MQALGQFATLLAWIAIISVVVWGLETVAEGMGYRRKTVAEQHTDEDHVPPLPEG